MKLNELLELNYANGKTSNITPISEVYGIIYRIFSRVENKSYVGQTYSHKYSGKYLQRHGLIMRLKKHWIEKDEELSKDRPLYRILNTYPQEEFEVFEELRVYGKDLARLNQIEGEYIQQYDCIYPNGYNVEVIGKRKPTILNDLAELYDFSIEQTEYEDTTRSRRRKDICLGTYFNLPKQQLGLDKTLELLKTLDIEKIRLVNSNGIRLLVNVRGEKDNIRVYFKKSKEECLEFASQLTTNLEITESFQGVDCYKYQSKLDNILAKSEDIKSVIGKQYENKARNCQTYLLIFYGEKNGKRQSLARVSFGGASQTIIESSNIAMEFIDKLTQYNKTIHFEYIFD